MNKIQKIKSATKNFVITNKAPIAFASGIAITGFLSTKLLKGQAEMYDTFLAEHDLLDQFKTTLDEVTN
jgi:hypothetical protein